MSAPTTICEDADGTTSDGNPCKLSPKEVGHGLGDWKYLVNFTPPPDAKADLKTRFPDEGAPDNLGRPATVYHNIDGGHGQINLDFYALQITKLPTYEDGSAKEAKFVLGDIRKNLGKFLGPQIATFKEYSPSDGTLWASSSPVKAVMKFRMLPQILVASQDAGVVCAESTDDHWIFSTTWTKDTNNHPVSGNRQFGLAILKPSATLPSTYAGVNFTNRDKDVLYFYTRGVDRVTKSELSVLASSAVFNGGHTCWQTMKMLLMTYINLHGGIAADVGYVSKRWDWASDVKKKLWDYSPP